MRAAPYPPLVDDRGAAAVEVATRVVALAAALREDAADLLAAESLTLPLADAVWVLDPALGPQPRKQVAARLSCDPSNVTVLADRLAAMGLLERVEDPGDRRVRALRLSAAGAAVRERIGGALAQAAPLGALDDRELALLADLLRRTG